MSVIPTHIRRGTALLAESVRIALASKAIERVPAAKVLRINPPKSSIALGRK